MTKTKKIVAAFIAAAIVGVTCVSSASASVPDSSGVIHACYTSSSGALRIIDSDNGGSCYSYETAVSWNADVPSLKVFTGSAGYTGGTVIHCPDGGIPVSLWLSSTSGSGYTSPGNVASNQTTESQSLAYPNGDTSQAPDGIAAASNLFSAGTIYYTIICS